MEKSAHRHAEKTLRRLTTLDYNTPFQTRVGGRLCRKVRRMASAKYRNTGNGQVHRAPCGEVAGGGQQGVAGAAGTPPEVSPQRRCGYNSALVHFRYYELYRMKTDHHWLHQKLVTHARQQGLKDAVPINSCQYS
jgi:hypothetical protein